MKFLALRDQLFKNRRESEAMNARQTKADIVNGITFVTLAEAGTIDEVTAAEHIDLFAAWQPNISYAVGNLVAYEGCLYKCAQAHSSQIGWEPTEAASLWAKTGDPTVEYPDWSQPIGSYDAYAQGDKVTHNDKCWVSTVDANVWEPGVYGWEEVI